MLHAAEFAVSAFAIGVGATFVMDLYAWLLRRLFSIPSLDYALVGRWIGHFPKGRFAHRGIGRAQPVAGERAVGWIAHYVIGIIFAAALLAVFGLDWARQPTLGPALIIGIGAIIFPFCVMQPAFGIGIAASKTPRPGIARLLSLGAHSAFALGLYLAGKLVAGSM